MTKPKKPKKCNHIWEGESAWEERWPSDECEPHFVCRKCGKVSFNRRIKVKP